MINVGDVVKVKAKDGSKVKARITGINVTVEPFRDGPMPMAGPAQVTLEMVVEGGMEAFIPGMQHQGNYGAPGYGAPGCDCPLPEKVSDTCPIHGTAQ